ncbi:MAG: hypothetical protein GEV13_23925 [Rhodospirillales bacterium]|nr:hypothetical protein [Rhodospirillales bacterium]
MRNAVIAALGGATAIVLAISVTPLLAHMPSVPASAEEITQALRGKICTTAAGATYTFGPDGRYGYKGLWKKRGQYEIGDGAITVKLDNGLERSFAISIHGNVFYMEQTALFCGPPEPVEARTRPMKRPQDSSAADVHSALLSSMSCGVGRRSVCRVGPQSNA